MEIISDNQKNQNFSLSFEKRKSKTSELDFFLKTENNKEKNTSGESIRFGSDYTLALCWSRSFERDCIQKYADSPNARHGHFLIRLSSRLANHVAIVLFNENLFVQIYCDEYINVETILNRVFISLKVFQVG